MSKIYAHNFNFGGGSIIQIPLRHSRHPGYLCRRRRSVYHPHCRRLYFFIFNRLMYVSFCVLLYFNFMKCMFILICFTFQIDASFSHYSFIFIYSCVLFTKIRPFSCLRDCIGLSSDPAHHHRHHCFRGPHCHPQSPPRLLLRLTAAAAPRHHHHFRRVQFYFSIYFGTFYFICCLF